MNKTDLAAASLFLALGLYLSVSSRFLPKGIGNLPGPGFFPAIIGILMFLLAGLLIRQALKGEPVRLEIENRFALAGSVGLTFLYLLLWGTGGFLARTVIFVALLLRLFGERWKRAFTVAVLLAAVITLGFRFGLRLTLE